MNCTTATANAEQILDDDRDVDIPDLGGQVDYTVSNEECGGGYGNNAYC
ncbi:hypothetical protein [Streptomyces hygroscopicus]|nr:hypothetical protein [Streptomyces hygroscopicus]